MPDWEKINEQKQRSISLCEARNGAILLMQGRETHDFDRLYKETAKRLFRLNRELDDELLNTNG